MKPFSSQCWRRSFFLAFMGLLLLGLPLLGFQKKGDKDHLDDLAFAQPLTRPYAQIELDYGTARALAPSALWAAFDRLLTAEHTDWQLFFDRATGYPNSMLGKGVPWIPGTGQDNDLTSENMGLPAGLEGKDVPVALVEQKARGFMSAYPELFGSKPQDLVLNLPGSGPMLDYLYYLSFDWTYRGIPVEKARVVFTLNHGNLIEVDQEFISPAVQGLDPTPAISPETAWQNLWGYLGQSGFDPSDSVLDPGRLLVVPVATPELLAGTPVAPGKGLSYRLVYVLAFHREGVIGNWEARVDAHTGEVLSFLDSNDYGTIRGGVYKTDKPFSEQDVPFPFADYGSGTYADQGGNFSGTTGTSTLTGRTGSGGNVGAVDITDDCGSISKAADGSGIIDFGTSGGYDCTTPGSGGAGNTHAARTQYWNVAQIKIKAYTYLPGNTWLQGLLVDRVNMNATCNAYWGSGSLHFFRSGGGCWNTGELPGVSMHEFGHGLDNNDGTAPADSGSGETYGDITALMQTHSSCLGNGFMGANCSGYGDVCTGCTGVRDLDYAKHASGTPCVPSQLDDTSTTTYHCPASGSLGACFYECHCESLIASQAVWDLAARDLITWGLDQATAWQLVDRLWYASRPTAAATYYCGGGITATSGCASGTLWRVFCAADDDNGNLADGTPHSTAISAALNRHVIACTTDAYYNKNYTTCPSIGSTVVTATPATAIVHVNWTAATNAVNYLVYRNETGCDAGYTKIATVATTTYDDSLVANGITYCYRVQAQGSTAVCVGAMSACSSATPLTCTPLAAPVTVTATPNGTYRIDVSWSAVGSALLYDLYRSTTSGGPWTLLTTTSSSVTSYSDTSVIGTKTYYYMVRTFATCESVNSTQASATAGGTCNQAPTFAGLTSAADGLNASCQNVLTWAAATSNCSGTITYSVYRSSIASFTPSAGTLIASGVSGTTYTDTGGAYKQTYYYIVRAVDSVSGSDSNTVVRSSYPTGAKSTIYSNNFEANWTGWTQGTVQTPGGGTVTGIWDWGTPQATTNNYGGPGQPGYDHTIGTTGKCLVTAYAAGSGAGANDVDYGEVWVRSPTFDGTVSPSVQLDMWRWWLNDHTYTVPGCSYPDFYSLEVTNNGGTGWTVLESYDDNCSTMKGCGTNAWINVKFLLESYVSLTNNMSVRMRVADGQTTAGTCDGDLAEGLLDDFYIYGYANCTACTAPAVPTGLSATPNGSNRIDLTWSGSANRYNVYRSEGACPGSTFTQIAGNVLTASYSDTTVSGGITYSYKITGLSATYCESAFSTCANATATGTCSLGPTFAGLTSASNSHSATCGITLSWSAATQKCGTGVVYNVYRSTSASFTPGDATRIAKGATGTTYGDTAGLVYGTTYYYVVRAEDNTTGGTGPNGGNEEINTVTKSSGPSGGQLTGSNIFFDNFESGSGTTGWDTGYFYGNATDVRGRMVCSPNQSTTHIFRWGGNSCTATYASSVASLMAPLPNAYGVDIPFDATNVKMDFYHRYIFAQTSTVGDGACLLVQKQPTSSYYFVQANALSGHVYNGTTSTGNVLGAGLPCWTGSYNTQMYLTTVNLDLVCQYIDGKPCAGSTLSIAFTGSSDASTVNYGWFLDDVKVYGDYGTTSCTTSGCSMLAEVAPSGTTTVNTGVDILFTASNTGGTPPYSYQWTEDGSNITGAITNTFAANEAVAISHTYNCKVTDSSGRCTNIQDTQSATGTWQSSSNPPPVPDGTVGGQVPFKIVKNSGTPANVDFTWDVTSCTAGNYQVVWGDIASLSLVSNVTNGTVTAHDCALGITGSATNQTAPSPTPGQCFFSVIDAIQGSAFGRHGNNSFGNERVLSGDTSQCTGIGTKNTTKTTCP